MNVGLVVLVGCLLGTGAIVYQGTMPGAEPVHGAPSSAIPAPKPSESVVIAPTVLAHAGTPTATPTPSPTVAPKLTLEQVRGLTRPGAASPLYGGLPRFVPAEPGAPASPAEPTAPLTEPSPTPVNESGQPPAATVTPAPAASPSATPVPDIPRIGTPPPLPPPPEGWTPRAVPTEQPH